MKESEQACVYEREKERKREGGRDTEAACASTRDLPHSRLPPLSSVPPPFLSLPFLLVVFFFYFFHFIFATLCASASFSSPCPLLLPPLILSPAVLPPFVPALHAEDDTSNFEEPEQAAPRQASAAQRGALPAGFQGQDLPFLGWFFSRALTTLAKTE